MDMKIAWIVFLSLLSFSRVDGQCNVGQYTYRGTCDYCPAGNICPNGVDLRGCPPGKSCSSGFSSTCNVGTSSLVNGYDCMNLTSVDQYGCKMGLEHWENSECNSNIIYTQTSCQTNSDCSSLSNSLLSQAQSAGYNFYNSYPGYLYHYPIQIGCIYADPNGASGVCMASCGKDQSSGDYLLFIPTDNISLTFFIFFFIPITLSYISRLSRDERCVCIGKNADRKKTLFYLISDTIHV
jgi:hypothetical protein